MLTSAKLRHSPAARRARKELTKAGLFTPADLKRGHVSRQFKAIHQYAENIWHRRQARAKQRADRNIQRYWGPAIDNDGTDLIQHSLDRTYPLWNRRRTDSAERFLKAYART